MIEGEAVADYRQVHTKIWREDEWYADQLTDGKLLFLYLFTNPSASIAGIYRLPLRTMQFDPTPLAFPLLVDRAREQVTSEKLADRIRRMATPLEKAADAERPAAPRFARGRSRGFRSGT
jgi:hypothetical protein